MLIDVRQRHLKTEAPWRTSDGGLSRAHPTCYHIPPATPASYPLLSPVGPGMSPSRDGGGGHNRSHVLVAGAGKQLGGPTAPSSCVATSNDGPDPRSARSLEGNRQNGSDGENPIEQARHSPGGCPVLVGYHLSFVRGEGSQNLFLLPLGHTDEVKGAP